MFAMSLRPMPASSTDTYNTHLLRIDPMGRKHEPGAPIIDYVEVACRLDKSPKDAIEEAVKALRFTEAAANLFLDHIIEMQAKIAAEKAAAEQKEQNT